MTNEKQVFDFGNVQTSCAGIAEIYTYLQQIETAAGFQTGESAERLSSRLGSVAGLASRIKAGIEDFVREQYGFDAENYPGGSKTEQVFSVLSEIMDLAFILTPPGELKTGVLQERLKKTDFLSTKLPFLIAALDAGEDLSEKKRSKF